MNLRAARGLRAEKTAEQWLQSRGLKTIQRNYRCRYGEVDLIMQDESTLVIVEVRARAVDEFLAPALSIDHRKQSKIIRTAEYFLQQHGVYADNPVRFDVIGLTGDGDSGIDWLRDAFAADQVGTD